MVVSPGSSEPILIVAGFEAGCPTIHGPVTSVYKKCRPSGRKCGQRWFIVPVAAVATSGVVTTVGTPPALETR